MHIQLFQLVNHYLHNLRNPSQDRQSPVKWANIPHKFIGKEKWQEENEENDFLEVNGILHWFHVKKQNVKTKEKKTRNFVRKSLQNSISSMNRSLNSFELDQMVNEFFRKVYTKEMSVKEDAEEPLSRNSSGFEIQHKKNRFRIRKQRTSFVRQASSPKNPTLEEINPLLITQKNKFLLKSCGKISLPNEALNIQKETAQAEKKKGNKGFFLKLNSRTKSKVNEETQALTLPYNQKSSIQFDSK